MYISDFKEEGQCILVAFKPEELATLSSTLYALSRTWRRYPGMNIGSCHCENVYSEEIDCYFRFSEMVEHNAQLQKILEEE